MFLHLIKHIQWNFCSDARDGTWGHPGGKKFIFLHGHVAYEIDGDDERNRIQVKFSPYGQTGDLGVRSKGQISLDFN